MGPLQSRGEHLHRLSPRKSQRPVQHEEGHHRTAQLLRQRHVPVHIIGVLAAAQDPAGVPALQPRVLGQLQQHLRLGQIPRLHQLGAQEHLVGPLTHPLLPGGLQQTVRVEGVDHHPAGQVVVQPLLGGHLRHPRRHLLDLLDGRTHLPGQRVVDRLTHPRREPGIQLETAPAHLYPAGAGEPAQGPLETALTDVAPRAHDVGPDLDLHEASPLNRTDRPSPTEHARTFDDTNPTASGTGSPCFTCPLCPPGRCCPR